MPNVWGEHRRVQDKGGHWAVVGCGVERMTSLSACIGLHRPQRRHQSLNWKPGASGTETTLDVPIQSKHTARA